MTVPASTNGRLVDVNAFTTLDFVEAAARGAGWTDPAPAVVDVRVHEADPDAVALDVELDGATLSHVEPHADRITLTDEQARTLADALLSAADRRDPDRGGRDGR